LQPLVDGCLPDDEVLPLVSVVASPLFVLIQYGLGCPIANSEDDGMGAVALASMSIPPSTLSLMEEALSPVVQQETTTKQVMSCLELAWDEKISLIISLSVFRTNIN